VTGRPLRILGVGNARSVIFLRWAWRLTELGHEVHVVSDRFGKQAAACRELEIRIDDPGRIDDDGLVAAGDDVRRAGEILVQELPEQHALSSRSKS
jgi:hypothetical protein